jgi:hypothetical protein
MRIKVSLVMALLVCTSVLAVAQEKKPEMAMPAEQKAQMDAWMKYMTPGEGHKLLDGMVGTFDAKVTMWTAPGAPASSSTGTSINAWVLGGRAVEQKFEGSFMGMPFTGVGYTGYDNAKKMYWGTWIDSMGTGVMTSSGNTADGGKSWKFAAVATDPMSGKDMTSEMRVMVADRDHHTMEMYGPGPDGKNYKMMEIVYTRKK